MELLLRQDVDRLGKRGEVVDVADGYARNYLLPRKLAVPLTGQNRKLLEAERRRAEKAVAEAHAQLEGLAQKLEGTSCTIMAKAGEGGHLFGSISSAQIAEAFASDGYEVTEDMVVLESPIRELGVYPIELKVGPNVKAATKVWVVAE